MKSKFAFDLPRLKIGASKAETKPAKEIPIGFDSPPPTPKSVRPPLSPRTDYELRTACALILQEYKPSDVIYDEQYGDLQQLPDVQDAQEDNEYEIVRSAVEREIESPLAPVNTTATRALRQRTMSGDRLSETARYEARPIIERSPQSDEWSESRGQRRSLLERAEELRFRLHIESKSPDEDDKPRHQRSLSSPLMLADLPPRDDVAERSGAALRSDSTMAEGATPGTEDEEYSWPASTAPTTAGITPARTSYRTSNVMRSESANASTAKFLASDTEWMRHELENYRKAQDGSNSRQGSGENAGASATISQDGETKETSGVQPPPVPPIPARKPVPRPGAESIESMTSHQRAKSRPSGELSRSGSKKRPTPRSESRSEIGLLRPESRQADYEPNAEAEMENIPISNATASHSFHRKPLSGIAAPLPSHNVSQAGSRSRSITRQIREYIRPSSRNQSRDASRPESRARSIESFTSSTSALAPSVDSSSKWRRWKPFNRNRDSAGSDDFGRPESRDSNKRGRAFSQDSTASPQKGKVNLNRELPPLPSLDQWKDADAVQQPSEATDEPAESTPTQNSSGEGSITSPASRSQKPSVDSTISRQPRDSVLVDNTLRVHPKRTTSLRARNNVQHQASDPLSASLPQSPIVGAEQKKDLRQSKSIQEFSPEANGSWTIVSSGSGFEKPAVPPKDNASNYPLPNSNVSRTMSQRIMPVATRRSGTSNTELHSRAFSDQQFNFSRKLSSEDYTRMHDTRYKNAMETPPRKPVPTNIPQSEQMEKPKKKKWWQSGKSKKNRQSWMPL